MIAYYFQVNIMCILLMLGIRTMLYDKIVAARRLAFNHLIATTCIMCLADIGTWVANGNDAPYARILSFVSNSVYDLAISFVCFIWLIYVKIRLEDYSYNHRKYMFHAFIPVGIMLILVLINPWTGWLFTVDANNVYTRGSALFLHWIFSWGYLVYSVILIAKELRETKDHFRREELFPLLLFIVAPAVGSVIQMIFYGVTTTQVGICISIMMIVFATINSQISLDSLTGLNNRRSMEMFLNAAINNRPQKITLIMVDVDNFKKINDTYGHPMGDRALQDIADALRSACGNLRENFFLCRYGGDEFLLIGIDKQDAATGQLCALISSYTEEKNKPGKNPYHLSVSIGTAESICKTHADVTELLKNADDRMYENKHRSRK